MSLTVDDITSFFDSSNQLKSMAGHTTLWVSLIGSGWVLGLIASLFLAPWASVLAQVLGAAGGYALGGWFYGNREFRQGKAAFEARDWKTFVYSLGDFFVPLVVATGAMVGVLHIIGVL